VIQYLLVFPKQTNVHMFVIERSNKHEAAVCENVYHKNKRSPLNRRKISW